MANSPEKTEEVEKIKEKEEIEDDSILLYEPSILYCEPVEIEELLVKYDISFSGDKYFEDIFADYQVEFDLGDANALRQTDNIDSKVEDDAITTETNENTDTQIHEHIAVNSDEEEHMITLAQIINRYFNELESGYRMHIANISEHVTRRIFRNVFMKFGDLNDIWISANRPKYGFVSYKRLEDALHALIYANGLFIFGQRVYVTVAKPKNQKELRRKLYRNIRCFNCHERGHLLRYCPFQD